MHNRFIGLPNNQSLLELAESTMDKVLAQSQSLPDENPSRLLYLSNRALIAADRLQHKKALAIWLQVLAGCERAFGTEHPYTARAMHDLARSGLGQTHLATKQFVEAESAFRETSSIYNTHIPNVWPAHYYELQIGTALVGQQRLQEAETIMTKSFARSESMRPSVPPALFSEAAKKPGQALRSYGQKRRGRAVQAKAVTPIQTTSSICQSL